jgi:hypothetical protein
VVEGISVRGHSPNVWPVADGTQAITSVASLRARRAAGQAKTDGFSNFSLFFGPDQMNH